MRNADLKFKIEALMFILDNWIDCIDKEKDPAIIFKEEFPKSDDSMSFPYQAGTYKARAELNADKLRRVRGWLENEFKNIGVQSRNDRI